MLWEKVLTILLCEVLGQVGDRSAIKKPFVLSRQIWASCLLGTCSRLGFVSDACASDRLLKREVLECMSPNFGEDTQFLTISQVCKVFENFANKHRSANTALASCPNHLIREAERKVVHAMQQAVLPQPSDSDAASSQVACSARHRRDSFSAISGRSSPLSSPRSTIKTAIGPSEAEHNSQMSQSDGGGLVPFAPPSGELVPYTGVGGHKSLGGLPQLPGNLDDLGASQLRKLLVDHHANWIRCANKLVSEGTSGSGGIAVASAPCIRNVKRKFRYWQRKARKQKKQHAESMQQLVRESDVYIRSKRRKSSAFRNKLTTFGGYKLALARNVGHSSCSATLAMLQADNTHRTSLTRRLPWFNSVLMLITCQQLTN